MWEILPCDKAVTKNVFRVLQHPSVQCCNGVKGPTGRRRKADALQSTKEFLTVVYG